MTNELSAGLGVRQPVSQIGGLAPFGVFRFNFSGKLSDLSNVSTGALEQLQTGLPLGPISLYWVLQGWAIGIEVNLTKISSLTSFTFIVNLRDSTVQPNVTAAQIFGATSPSFTQALLTSVTGDQFGSGTLFVLALSPGGKDAYGNTISAGDQFVIDVAITASQAVSVYSGTFKASAWVTMMGGP